MIMWDKQTGEDGEEGVKTPSDEVEFIGEKRSRGRTRKHIGTIKYDFDLRYRGLYREARGANYLMLKKEYGVDGSRLVERVFADAELIIAARSQRRADALRKKSEAEAELQNIVAGGKT